MPVEDSYWDIMKSPIADMKASCQCRMRNLTMAPMTCCPVSC
jgi:hypothetical protein